MESLTVTILIATVMHACIIAFAIVMAAKIMSDRDD